jgi:hypothetical protein
VKADNSFYSKSKYTNLAEEVVELLNILFIVINIHYFKTVFNGLDALLHDFFSKGALSTEHFKNLLNEFNITGDDPFQAFFP